MTDTPKDGDLGRTMGGAPCRWRDGKWRYGQGLYIVNRPADVTPTGERAVSIRLCEDAALLLRQHGYTGMADILDPPTPTPDEPRWPENTIVNYGDSEYLYIVNADGVPCSRRGIRTGFPLDSDWWRVVGTFTPKGDA